MFHQCTVFLAEFYPVLFSVITNKNHFLELTEYKHLRQYCFPHLFISLNYSLDMDDVIQNNR